MAHVEVDVLVVDAAALLDFREFGARDDVAGGEFAVVGCVPVLEHEALALGVVEDAALPADALADEHPCRGERRWVELNHLHVLHRDAGAVRDGDAVTGVGDGVGRVVVRLAETAGRQNHAVAGAEAGDFAALDVPRDDAVAVALVGVVLVGDGDLADVPLVVDFDASFDHLLVQRVEHVVAGLGARVRRPREREAAERPLADRAVLLAGERHPPVFELDDFLGCVLRERVDCGGVAEVVRPLHRVVRVVFPRVALLQGGVDATLGSARVRAHRVEFRDDCYVCAFLVGGDCGAEPRATAADYDYVVLVHVTRI